MILTVVFYIFVACAVIQLIYYLGFSSILFKKKTTKENSDKPPVSVLLFVKNSSEYLEENLPFFINQNYPKFEIILVNNASSDNTNEILEKLKEKYQNMRVIDVENNESFWGNKKYTYTLAIKAAKYEHLLFSEVKAKPNSKNWIFEITKSFTDEKTVIIGYNKTEKQNSLLNLIVRFDNLLNVLKSFSFTKLGSPFSASKYNYAIKKSEFFRVKGFINHIKIREGKDDLFIKDVYQNKNVTFSISENSFTAISNPKSFKEWLKEKRNRSFIKSHYSLKNRILLDLFLSTKALLYILVIVCFFFHPWQIISSILGGYLVIQFLVIGFSSKTFKEPLLPIFLPFLEIILVLIQISIFIANLVSKPNNWK